MGSPYRNGSEVEAQQDPAAAQYQQASFNFYDRRVMGGAWEQEARPHVIKEFFRVLAVCHTVIPDGAPPFLLTLLLLGLTALPCTLTPLQLVYVWHSFRALYETPSEVA